MIKKLTVFISIIVINIFSTNAFSLNAIEQQFQVFQDAILHRDGIIKTLIKRIELLEGEVETIKNQDKIKQIVEQSLQNQPPDKTPEAATKNIEDNISKTEHTLAEKAFERQLLERGNLVLPLNTSVMDFGITTINAATDNIIIDGFAIFPVVVVGDIVSERVRRDTTQLSLGWRKGLPYDLQFETSVAWNYLNISRVKADTDEENFYDTGAGDLTLGLSYQWTNDHEWLPDSLIAARWKTTTGQDPYKYSDPENHSTGSGFNAVNIFYTAVTVDDPLAYYGGFSYTYNFDDQKSIGRIKPGNTIGFSLGTSIALNFKSSWSFGFSQSWTKKTRLNGQDLSGTNLTTATLNLGFNYALNNKLSLNTSLGIGLTEDSPDFQFGFNVPMRFGF